MMVLKESMMPMAVTLFFMVAYTFNKYHVMNNLIICEFITSSMMIFMFTLSKIIQVENHFVLFMLIIIVTESVVGLTLMVNLIRTHSNDFMKSMNLMKF